MSRTGCATDCWPFPALRLRQRCTVRSAGSCQMTAWRSGLLQILETVIHYRTMRNDPPSDFHMQVLGSSHKGDRWTAKMGLAPASEKVMFIKHSAATHTRLLKLWWCGPVLFTMFGERRWTKWHNLGREGEQEGASPVLRWHFNESKRQGGEERSSTRHVCKPFVTRPSVETV